MRLFTMLVCGILVVAGCGGGPRAQDVEQPLQPPVTQSTIRESTTKAFRGSVVFAATTVTETHEAGEVFAQIECKGCETVAARDGGPGVPIITHRLAVPQGARVVLADVKPVVGEVLQDVLLRPYQAQEGDYSPEYGRPGPISEAARDWQPPFVYDRSAYADDTPQPRAAVAASPIQRARNASFVILRIAAGHYEATSKRLTLYSSVNFTVTFEGGADKFMDSDSGSPFDKGSASLLRSSWNWDAVESEAPFVPKGGTEYGEELLILTHPDFRIAADRLAQHKNNLGLLTSVFTVNDGPTEPGPDGKEAIKAFLDDRHANTLVRASYLILFGDAEHIEPYRLPNRYRPDEDPYPTDFPYAQINRDPDGDDLYPDVSLGRLSVTAPHNAENVVNKIINYELEPPVESLSTPFFRKAALAVTFWQIAEDRPTVEHPRALIARAERTIDELESRGYEVQRIYSAEQPLTSANTPTFTSDGVTELPPPLRPADGFPWDGDRDAVVAAFHAGNSIMIYTGHGHYQGWEAPAFTTTRFPYLSNGRLLPFVVNACCAAGGFDYPKQGFAEAIVRRFNGGGIASVAFTRDANSNYTAAMLKGVTSALRPAIVTELGAAARAPRFGDIVDHARALMAERATADMDTQRSARAHTHVRMLELFGDPTLRLWQGPPIFLPEEGTDYVADDRIGFAYPLVGARITAVEDRDGSIVPVGRATVGTDGRVSIDPIVEPSGEYALRFFAVHAEGIAREITILQPER